MTSAFDPGVDARIGDGGCGARIGLPRKAGRYRLQWRKRKRSPVAGRKRGARGRWRTGGGDVARVRPPATNEPFEHEISDGGRPPPTRAQ